MISAAAITLALAFWAPYNHGQPVCPDGVVVHQVWRYSNDDVPGTVSSAAYRKFVNGALEPNCNVYVAPQFRGMTVAEQCAFVARALGAAWFGLPPSGDRRNIMYYSARVIPGACKP